MSDEPKKAGVIKAGAKNKVTTGVGLAAGLPILVSQIMLIFDGNDATSADWRAVLAAVCAIVLGFVSRDANKSSEESAA